MIGFDHAQPVIQPGAHTVTRGVPLATLASVRILDELDATRLELGSEPARRNLAECAVDGVIRPEPLG